MMSTTFTHTQYVEDSVNNMKSTVVVPSEARREREPEDSRGDEESNGKAVSV